MYVVENIENIGSKITTPQGVKESGYAVVWQDANDWDGCVKSWHPTEKEAQEAADAANAANAED